MWRSRDTLDTTKGVQAGTLAGANPSDHFGSPLGQPRVTLKLQHKQLHTLHKLQVTVRDCQPMREARSGSGPASSRYHRGAHTSWIVLGITRDVAMEGPTRRLDLPRLRSEFPTTRNLTASPHSAVIQCLVRTVPCSTIWQVIQRNMLRFLGRVGITEHTRMDLF